MKYTDGRTRETGRLPGTRQSAEEREYDAALRVLKAKLRFPDNTYELDIGSLRYMYVRNSSPFPGIQSVKRMGHISCTVNEDQSAMLTRLGLLGPPFEIAV